VTGFWPGFRVALKILAALVFALAGDRPSAISLSRIASYFFGMGPPHLFRDAAVARVRDRFRADPEDLGGFPARQAVDPQQGSRGHESLIGLRGRRHDGPGERDERVLQRPARLVPFGSEHGVLGLELGDEAIQGLGDVAEAIAAIRDHYFIQSYPARCRPGASDGDARTGLIGGGAGDRFWSVNQSGPRSVLPGGGAKGEDTDVEPVILSLMLLGHEAQPLRDGASLVLRHHARGRNDDGRDGAVFIFLLFRRLQNDRYQVQLHCSPLSEPHV
jgi:hypothetical protein